MVDATSAYRSHKATAKSRGVPFLMTYEEWLGVWVDSGKFELRGKGHGKYVMARKGDTGPYQVGNVYICSFAQNITDSVANGCRHRKPSPKQLILAAVKGAMEVPASAVSTSIVKQATTYREAVRLAWQMRRVKEMTLSMLAALAELYAPHVTDYLHADDKPQRRDLPAHAIARFESVVGNTMVSQWLAAQSGLTVLEEMQENRKAA